MGNEWETKALKEVGKIVSGATPKTNVLEYWDGSISWVTPKDLGKIFGQKYIIETTRSITELGLKSCSAQLMPKGSIIMSSRAPIGHLAIAIHDLCTNQGCKSIVPNDNMVSEYIYYYLLSNRDKLNKLGKGAVFPELSGKLFGDFKIPIPSFEDQQKIVEKLDKAFELIDQAKANIERNIQNAKELFQSKLNELFSQVNEEWGYKELKDLVLIRPPKREVKEFLSDDENVTFLPMEDLGISQLYTLPSKEKTLENVYKSYTYFREGDLLIAKITPCFENGKMGIARNLVNEVGFGSSEYIVLRSKDEVMSELIYYNLLQDRFRIEGKSNMQGAVGHKRVTLDFVGDFLISYPIDMIVQRTLVNKLLVYSDDLKRLQALCQEKLVNLEELRKSILEKAFKGELTN